MFIVIAGYFSLVRVETHDHQNVTQKSLHNKRGAGIAPAPRAIS
jgi:hypothetical protein